MGQRYVGKKRQSNMTKVLVQTKSVEQGWTSEGLFDIAMIGLVRLFFFLSNLARSNCLI